MEIVNGGDIWEGNTLTDVDLLCSFFKFMYVRTWGGNVNIGKEKDKLFDINWALLKGKIARATYFEVQPAWSPLQNVERYKRNYPLNDPGDIPEMIVYEIAPPTTKSKTTVINESERIYDDIASFLGHQPLIYTGRWYWDPLFGTNTKLAAISEFIISSYYWSNAYARSITITSYAHLSQFIPNVWTTGVLGSPRPPLGVQWSGDQFRAPGILGWMDFIKLSIPITQFKKMRLGTGIPVPEIPPMIEVPAYIEICKNFHALNVSFRSQLGNGADKYHNDCGAACVSMVISAYTQQNVSVDEIYARISPYSDRYLTVAELRNSLSWYGINTVMSYDLSKEKIWSSTINRTPFIALVNYKPFVDAGLADTGVSFSGMHFIVVVGLDADGVLIHDPLFKDKLDENGKLIPAEGFRHIPFSVYDRAVRSEGAGVLLIPTKKLGLPQLSEGVNYIVTVEVRYVRTLPNTSTGIYVESKLKGEIVNIEEVVNNWGRLTGTTNWMYMPGLIKI